jgi:hypothetical protein
MSLLDNLVESFFRIPPSSFPQDEMPELPMDCVAFVTVFLLFDYGVD